MKIKSILCICLLVWTVLNLNAQNVSVPTGEIAMGSDGPALPGTGQVNSQISNNNEETVFQLFEITVMDGKSEDGITLHTSVYQNPTNDFVTLSFDRPMSASTRFHLVDENGKMIMKHKVNSSEVEINMEELAAGVYFIKVLVYSSEMKTFKITKNR